MGNELILSERREISFEDLELPHKIMDSIIERQFYDLVGFQRGFHSALTKVQDLIRNTSLLSNTQKKALWKEVKAMKS